MAFSSPGYWSRLPLPSPGDLPDSEIEPESLESSALADGVLCQLSHQGSPLSKVGSADSYQFVRADLGGPEHQAQNGPLPLPVLL